MSREDILALAEVRRKTASGEARATRLAVDLTLREIGQHCGVSGDAVRAWELSRCVPRGLAALRYARLLEALEAKLAAASSRDAS